MIITIMAACCKLMQHIQVRQGLFGNLDYPYVISARKFSLEEALEKSKLWIQNYEKLKVCGQKSVEESYTRLELLENDIRCLLEKRK